MTPSWILEPWASELMVRALTVAVLSGALCGVLGCFVLVRGLAFVGESVAHTAVLGVVLAVLAGVPVAAGAIAVAVATVVGVHVIGQDRRFGEDTAMGILLPSLFGAAVVLATFVPGYRARLQDVLFGSVLSVTQADVAATLAVALVCAAVLAIAGKELVLVAFDRAAAQAMGYRARALDLVFLALVALAGVVALRAVGNVLLTALLLGPPATARLLSRTFWPMAAVAGALGAGAAVVGLYATWYLDVGAGPAIVLAVTAGYAAVAAAAGLRRSAREAAAA
jgi:manganese/iron transport system permease protein